MEDLQAKLSPTEVLSGTRLDNISGVRLDLTPAELTRLTALFPGLLVAPTSLNVAEFLQRTGLAYDDLLDLLYSDFVHNPVEQPGPIQVVFQADSDCDLTSALLQPITPLAQNLIERFTRLRRRLGWTAYEVDAALRVFGSIVGTAAPLHKLADVRALQASLGIDVVEMLSWWGPMQTKPQRDGRPSLYATVFQNKTVLSISNDELTAFELGPANDALNAEGDQIVKHLPALAAALNVGPVDLQWILQPEALAATSGLPSGPATLTLANVNAFYRTVSLARALGLSVRDFLLLRVLTAIDPFQGGPAATRALLKARDAITASPFTLQELGELLIGIAPAPGSPFLTEDAAAALLADLQAKVSRSRSPRHPAPTSPEISCARRWPPRFHWRRPLRWTPSSRWPSRRASHHRATSRRCRTRSRRC